MASSACAGMPVSTFFLEKGQRGEKAKEICEGCPVKNDCLSYAKRTGSTGIWGATVLNEHNLKEN